MRQHGPLCGPRESERHAGIGREKANRERHFAPGRLFDLYDSTNRERPECANGKKN